jgi:hypothetical protein
LFAFSYHFTQGVDALGIAFPASVLSVLHHHQHVEVNALQSVPSVSLAAWQQLCGHTIPFPTYICPLHL